MDVENKVPETFKKIIINNFNKNYNESICIIDENMKNLLKKLQYGTILVKNHYVGIGASEVNSTSGNVF